MTIIEAKEFREMMARCIPQWDNGKNMKNAALRSKALDEIANSE